MKKLGLIGGVGPESTIPYYQGIVFGVKERMGKPYFPPLVIESLSCFEVIRMSSEGDLEGLTEYLLAGIRNLAAAGAEVGALACNTGHLVFEELEKASPIPLVSIVDATCEEVKRKGFHRVGLLGTQATMESDFFWKPFREEGIEVVIPDIEARNYIGDRIYHELEMGIIKEETAQHILSIVAHMVETEHIEAVILGCTELPFLFQGKETPIPFLNTMEIHIEKLIQVMMEKETAQG